MNNAEIRAVHENDTESAVEVLAQAFGEMRRKRIHDRLVDRTTGLHHALVAEDNGAIVGVAMLCADPLYPGTLFAIAAVAAHRRGAGIGTELVTTLVAAAHAVKPAQQVSLTLPDDQPAGRRFAERFGFRVIEHSVGWRMPLAGRTDELRKLSRAAAERAGVRIAVTTPAADPDLATDIVVRSMPGLPRQAGAFDVQESRKTVPGDAPVFLAFPSDPSSGRALAICTIVPVGTDGEWLTMYTGVDADHRGRGIARAVKTAALAYVAEQGGTAMITHNDETNEPILHVNKSLGMTPGVGFWTFARHGLPPKVR